MKEIININILYLYFCASKRCVLCVRYEEAWTRKSIFNFIVTKKTPLYLLVMLSKYNKFDHFVNFNIKYSMFIKLFINTTEFKMYQDLLYKNVPFRKQDESVNNNEIFELEEYGL